LDCFCQQHIIESKQKMSSTELRFQITIKRRKRPRIRGGRRSLALLILCDIAASRTPSQICIFSQNSNDEHQPKVKATPPSCPAKGSSILQRWLVRYIRFHGLEIFLVHRRSSSFNGDLPRSAEIFLVRQTGGKVRTSAVACKRAPWWLDFFWRRVCS